MSQFKQIDLSSENLRKYWDGPSNVFARYYSYLQRGLGLFNETKNYLLLAFGTYWTVKTMDLWVNSGFSDNLLVMGLLVSGVVGVVGLIFAGRWDLFKLSKAREFISAQHGSVTGYNSYNMTVLNTALMEAIAIKLGVNVEELKKELK